ncbi:MAG TPA: histidine kinase [Acidobacteriaceae bacterium]|nr:histidine kinase [Acidobacteriaceae bacterium]
MSAQPARDNPAKTPEQWLEKAAPEKTTGILKLFLGYAPGVGKTFNMLSEAIRRRKRGEDIIVGFVETHRRSGVMELAAQVESIPTRRVEYKGTFFEELDIDAILARKPEVVIIDELAHTNIPGSKHEKRYEDVLELLENNIDVLSALNVQHIESLTPTVQNITGITVRETVPDWVLGRADEVVLVDVTPEALQTRMRRGDIYPHERIERSLANFFRRGNLLALRELALKRVTHAVDQNLDAYLRRKHIGDNWVVHERVAVCISSNPASQQLIARGARMAEGMDAEFFVLHVDLPNDGDEENRRNLAANIRFAENLSARIIHLQGSNVSSTVATFVRENRITQIIFGRSAVHGWRKYLYYMAIQRLLREAPHVDVHIVTQEMQ